MFLVGLTGGVATGKSTVSKMFMDLGVPVIDADLIARRIVEPGQGPADTNPTVTKQLVLIFFAGRPAWKRIRAEFGSDVFDAHTGELDRAALRGIIFEDEAQRKKLNRITHPEIYRLMTWEAVKHAIAGHQYVVLDLPLLFEAGKNIVLYIVNLCRPQAHFFSFESDVMVGYMHKIIVVTCEEDLQLQRLMEQRQLSERESKLMIDAQMPLDAKAAMAQFVIENSGSMNDTKEQVREPSPAPENIL